MPPRVLIVDDDPATREGLAELLDSIGYEAVAAGCFELARDILRTAPQAVLITDIRLGEYNGLQLLLQAPVAVPAIVTSGFSDPVLRRAAEQLGATYLTKPISASQLLNAVRHKTALAGASPKQALLTQGPRSGPDSASIAIRDLQRSSQPTKGRN